MAKRRYTVKMAEALVRRNAEACETAKHKACQCHCGGAQHGRKHTAEWVSQTALDMVQAHEKAEQQAQEQLQLLHQCAAQP